jgi:hypothetical protein
MSTNKFNDYTTTSSLDEKNNVQHIDHTSTPSDENVIVSAQTGEEGEGEPVKVGNICITPHMSPEEKAAAIKLANDADPGPPLGSWRYLKFLVTAFLVILNSGDSGKS